MGDEVAVMNAAKEELVIIQAQLEQQLKNIREVRYDEIEKVMRQCEGGAEEACPSYTLADACAYCGAGEECQAEEGVDYPGNDLNDGIDDSQPSLTSCVSFCEDNYPQASHYS